MRSLNVLIACEESQTTANAFRALGHNAFSCDLQDCSGGHPEYHILGDCLSITKPNCSFVTCANTYHTIKHWDLIIAHPPCTYLCAASAVCMFPKGKLNKERYQKMLKGREFFMKLLNSDCPYVAVENPRPLSIAHLPKPSQVVYPFDFGDPWSKRTYLWLRNLPPLISTLIVPDYDYWTLRHSGSKQRSKSFKGLSEAMANQWSNFILFDYYDE